MIAFTLFLVVSFCLYFLPAIIAHDRHKRNAGTITVVNLLLGWTFVGWFVALVWAASRD